MPISRIPGVGLDTGSSGVAPSNLSTGAPSWDGSGNLSFNSGYGSNGVAYACRAWVNFNGTGTVAIRASGNVTSITDNNVGDYTVNFTTAMPDANYSVTGATANNDSSSAVAAQINLGTIATITNTSLRFFIGRQYSPYSYQDIQQINIAVFR